MRKIHWPTMLGLQERQDALATYRARIVYAVAGIGAAVMLPCALLNFHEGRLLVGGGTLLGMVVLVADALAVYSRRKPLLPLGLILVSSLGAVVLSLRSQGFYGALWSYPAVLLYYFLLTRRNANLCAFLQLAAVTPLVWQQTGGDLALRFGVTLLLTIALINLALRIIDDLHERLVEQAILDPLTGAYNRRSMQSCLDYAVERSRRNGGMPTLLLIDIDHFKRINDMHGHAGGDKVLQEVVLTMRARARRLDLLFRIGGEEFLLLLPDTREADAARLADDLRLAIAHNCLMQGKTVTVSIGVCELQANETPESWLSHADQALYLAKEMGRDRIVQRTGLYLFATDRA